MKQARPKHCKLGWRQRHALAFYTRHAGEWIGYADRERRVIAPLVKRGMLEVNEFQQARRGDK